MFFFFFPSFYYKEAVDYLNKNTAKEEDAEDYLIQFKANDDNLYKDALKMLDERAKKYVRDDGGHNSEDDEDYEYGAAGKKLTMIFYCMRRNSRHFLKNRSGSTENWHCC